VGGLNIICQQVPVSHGICSGLTSKKLTEEKGGKVQYSQLKCLDSIENQRSTVRKFNIRRGIKSMAPI